MMNVVIYLECVLSVVTLVIVVSLADEVMKLKKEIERLNEREL